MDLERLLDSSPEFVGGTEDEVDSELSTESGVELKDTKPESPEHQPSIAEAPSTQSAEHNQNDKMGKTCIINGRLHSFETYDGSPGKYTILCKDMLVLILIAPAIYLCEIPHHPNEDFHYGKTVHL